MIAMSGITMSPSSTTSCRISSGGNSYVSVPKPSLRTWSACARSARRSASSNTPVVALVVATQSVCCWSRNTLAVPAT
jgi:hypothetical protein